MATRSSGLRRRDLLLAAGAAAIAAPPLVLLHRRSKADVVEIVGGEAFGTRWQVSFLPAEADGDTVRQHARQVFDRVDAALSGWRDDSEVARFAALEPGASMPVSTTTLAVLDAAVRMGALAGGAFDVTVGPLVRLFGGGAHRGDQPPADRDVDRVRAAIGLERVMLDTATQRLGRSSRQTTLDASGIAQGRAVDTLVATLRSNGLRNLAVELGGEVRCLGARPDGTPWRVGIARPAPQGRQVFRTVAMHDAALATSRSWRGAGERERPRIIDPRTGRPVAHGLVAVTVAARETMWADAWSTALLVLGPQRAGPVAEDHGVAALFLVASEGRFQEYWSPAFEALAADPAFQLPS